jgi:DNA invertase Pin-like site-specific DNA recombinase
MALYGYTRVSNSNQDGALKEQALRAAGAVASRYSYGHDQERNGCMELELGDHES